MSKRRYVEFAKSGEKPPETPQHVKLEPSPKLEPELKSLIFGFERSGTPNLQNLPIRPFFPAPFFSPQFEGKLTSPSGPWGVDLLDDAPPIEEVKKTTTPDGTESKPEPEPQKPEYKHNYQLRLRVQAIIDEEAKTDLLTNWELLVLQNYTEDCEDDYDMDRRRERMIRNLCNSCAYKDVKWEKN